MSAGRKLLLVGRSPSLKVVLERLEMDMSAADVHTEYTASEWHDTGASMSTVDNPDGDNRILFDTGLSDDRQFYRWTAADEWSAQSEFTVTGEFDEGSYAPGPTRFGIAVNGGGDGSSETAAFMCQNGGRNLRIGVYDNATFSFAEDPLTHYNYVDDVSSKWRYTLHKRGSRIFAKMDRSLGGSFATRLGWDMVHEYSPPLSTEGIGFYNYNGPIQPDVHIEKMVVDTGPEADGSTGVDVSALEDIGPVFVASVARADYSDQSSGTNTIYVTRPQASIAGDLLIAFVLDRSGAATPSRWTSEYNISAGVSSQFLRVYSRRATGDFSDDLSLSVSGSSRNAVTVLALRCLDPSRRPKLNKATSTTQASASSHTFSAAFDNARIDTGQGGLILLGETCVYASSSVSWRYDFAEGANPYSRCYNPQSIVNARMHVSATTIFPGSEFTELGDYATSLVHGAGGVIAGSHACSRVALAIEHEAKP